MIISEKSFLQDHLSFFLTIRKKAIGNIREELKRIEIIGQNQIFFKNKSNLINSLTSSIKKILYLIIKQILLNIIGKKKINRIVKILYNISLK